MNPSVRLLAVDLGFFRVRLVGALAPIVFGCNWARIDSHFENATLADEPTITRTPDEATAKVEYGARFRARIRFSAASPARIIDGNARIEYPLTSALDSLVDAEDADATMCAILNVRPQWFEADSSDPVQTTMSGTDQILVSRFLQKLNDQRVVVEKVFPL